MQLIRRLTVSDGRQDRQIGLYAGDLARIPAGQAVDLLVVSAFPDSYRPLPGTLIGALQQRGLSLARLAADKEHDLRQVSAFWLSRPLAADYPDMHIGRIACFEPLLLGPPPQVVGELFRGLFPFLDQDRDAVVAMPLLGAGNQRWPPEAIFRPLLEAAVHWLQRGMPISELRIVEIQEQRVRDLAQQFDAFERGLREPAPVVVPAPPPASVPRGRTWRIWPFAPRRAETESLPPRPAPAVPEPAGRDGFDVFLSYAEEDKEAAQRIARLLQAEVQDIRIFDYRFSIDVGQSWQQEIDAAIEGCKKIVALMSADYFASPECKEELMIARLRNKRSNFEVFFPLYWKDAGRALAMWLQATTYSDCREGDAAKLGEVARRLASQLR
jgi:hypothetical protein